MGSFRDLLPVILVVLFFQLLVLQQPLPNIIQLIIGILLVTLGLTFFMNGLEMALFPIGESLAFALAKKGSLSGYLFLPFFLALEQPQQSRHC